MCPSRLKIQKIHWMTQMNDIHLIYSPARAAISIFPRAYRALFKINNSRGKWSPELYTYVWIYAYALIFDIQNELWIPPRYSKWMVLLGNTIKMWISNDQRLHNRVMSLAACCQLLICTCHTESRSFHTFSPNQRPHRLQIKSSKCTIPIHCW